MCIIVAKEKKVKAPSIETLKTCLVKGLDRDDVNMILDKMTLIDSNKYKQALRKVAETLE